MSAAGLSLLAAMRAALLARPPLVALLGGGHVHDELPHGAKPPFVAFGDVETRDWSVADSSAHEHFVSLHARTASRGRSQAQALAGEIEAALDGAALVLDGHRLVSLRLVFWSVARERNGEHFTALMRFRAATEPLQEDH